MDDFDLDGLVSSYEAFNYAFRGYCLKNFRALGLRADFVPNALKLVHQRWQVDCEEWQTEVVEKSPKISYLKTFSLLLHNLCRTPFLESLDNHEYSDLRDEIQIDETIRELSRRELIDGREAVLALDFCFLTLDWIEINRTDRKISYVMPLTEDMRRDLLVYLISGETERKAIYLILKALFLRNTDGGSNN
jgi:hypothetical protein